MKDTDEDPEPPDRLPNRLIERLDALDIPDLKAVLSYVEQRIESLHPSIKEEIQEEAAGEIIEINDHGSYALVRKHPPDPNGSGANRNIESLYHVRRERHPDGHESLHWVYLGDVHNAEHVRCGTCGRTFATDVAVCPHCGNEEFKHTESED